MPTFSNAGGSLGSAIILTLVAWGVRWARAELGRRKQLEADDSSSSPTLLKLSPYHASVGVKTLFGLLETRACKFLLVDVRPFTEADFVDGTLGVGETDVHGSLLPMTPRIVSPRASGRHERGRGVGVSHAGGIPRVGVDDDVDDDVEDEAEAKGETTPRQEKNVKNTNANTNGKTNKNTNTNGKMDVHSTLSAKRLQKTLSLPREFRGAIRLPYNLVGDVLSSREAWEATFPHVKCPDTFTILVLLGESEEQECRAASRLNALGYQRSLCVKGSIQALLREDEDGFEMGFGKGPEVTYISRDGLATLLLGSSRGQPGLNGYAGAELSSSGYSAPSESSGGFGGDNIDNAMNGSNKTDILMPPTPQQHDFLVIDVRRKDEVILYGAIHGAKNIPVDQLASALSPSMTNAAFQQMYHFDKPNKNQLLVFCSRAFSRATWAAHVAMDAGYSRVCAYDRGVCGWKLDAAVAGYTSYGLGDAPPSPMSGDREAVDHQRGFAELADLVVRTGLTL